MLKRFFAQMVSPFITAGKWALNGGKWAYEQLSKIFTACIAQLRALSRRVGGHSEALEDGPPEAEDVGGFDEVHEEELQRQHDAGSPLEERGIIDLDSL